MKHIRSAAYAATLALGTLVITLALWPAVFFGKAAIRRVIKAWARMSLISLRIICGIRYRIEGVEFIPSGGAIVAVNHQSMWETIALAAILERPVLVFKKELLKVPFYGWWAVKSGSIPVDRGAGVKALKSLTKIARERVAAGSQVVVFPEGTRARAGERLRLQPGVASVYLAANAPCTPAVHDSGACWLPPGTLTAPKVPGLITLRFFPAIPPGLSRKAFMDELTAKLHGGMAPVGNEPAREAEGAAA